MVYLLMSLYLLFSYQQLFVPFLDLARNTADQEFHFECESCSI